MGRRGIRAPLAPLFHGPPIAGAGLFPESAILLTPLLIGTNVMERKTSRSFDIAKGLWTGSYNTNPKDQAVCDLWRLFFVEPSYPVLDAKANKAATKEHEAVLIEMLKAAKESAQVAYDSLPTAAKTTLGHGVNRVVGDKLNTSKAETDSAKVQDARKDWVALYSGESRMRAGGPDSKTVARAALATLEAIMNSVAIKASEKFEADSDAIKNIAAARDESVEVFNTWLDTEAAKRIAA